jgi:hypothetical protein
MSLRVSCAALGWMFLLVAIMPMMATAGANNSLADDPMEPIADSARALAGLLEGVIVVTRDLAMPRGEDRQSRAR